VSSGAFCWGAAHFQCAIFFPFRLLAKTARLESREPPAVPQTAVSKSRRGHQHGRVLAGPTSDCMPGCRLSRPTFAPNQPAFDVVVPSNRALTLKFREVDVHAFAHARCAVAGSSAKLVGLLRAISSIGEERLSLENENKKGVEILKKCATK